MWLLQRLLFIGLDLPHALQLHLQLVQRETQPLRNVETRHYLQAGAYLVSENDRWLRDFGQNAVQQAKMFSAAVPITGLVVTKLDGTARGGVVVAVHEALDVPVKYLGVGESGDDLVQFDASEFAQELLGEE